MEGKENFSENQSLQILILVSNSFCYCQTIGTDMSNSSAINFKCEDFLKKYMSWMGCDHNWEIQNISRISKSNNGLSQI